MKTGRLQKHTQMKENLNGLTCVCTQKKTGLAYLAKYQHFLKLMDWLNRRFPKRLTLKHCTRAQLTFLYRVLLPTLVGQFTLVTLILIPSAQGSIQNLPFPVGFHFGTEIVYGNLQTPALPEALPSRNYIGYMGHAVAGWDLSPWLVGLYGDMRLTRISPSPLGGGNFTPERAMTEFYSLGDGSLLGLGLSYQSQNYSFTLGIPARLGHLALFYKPTDPNLDSALDLSKPYGLSFIAGYGAFRPFWVHLFLQVVSYTEHSSDIKTRINVVDKLFGLGLSLNLL